VARTLSRLPIAALLLVSALQFGEANARSLNNGITVSLRQQSTVPPDQIVCFSVCHRGTYLQLTIWKDGRMDVDGRPARVSMADAARFSTILRPFRPIGKDATADPSQLLPDFCPVKVQWSADQGGGRPVVCGTYSRMPNSLFPVVMDALGSIHLDIAVPGTS
jgi:hypothetical protein